MAKKKENKAQDRFSMLESAKAAHQFDVGVGGSIQHDADMSHVRGVALPSLSLMELVGSTTLRDSMSILIDGEPSSSKSSLALEMYNWLKFYGGTGTYIDGECKAAVPLANGTLDLVHLYHPTQRVEILSCNLLEKIQSTMWTVIERCEQTNRDLDRDYNIPFMGTIDPLSGVPSEEHLKAAEKAKGVADRGHGGRDEALLWSKWIKLFNAKAVNIPFILIMVNHMKEKQVEIAKNKTVSRNYNPGGCAQNYNVTLHLRMRRIEQKVQQTDSLLGDAYQTLRIECIKNSHGPDGGVAYVRKYARRQGGGTIFWWDWDRSSAEFLSNFGAKHESKDICSVVKSTETKYSCKQLGLKDEDPSTVGKAIHADAKMVDQLADCFHWKKLRQYKAISEEDYAVFTTQAQAEKERLEALAEKERLRKEKDEEEGS